MCSRWKFFIQRLGSFRPSVFDTAKHGNSTRRLFPTCCEVTAIHDGGWCRKTAWSNTKFVEIVSEIKGMCMIFVLYIKCCGSPKNIKDSKESNNINQQKPMLVPQEAKSFDKFQYGQSNEIKVLKIGNLRCDLESKKYINTNKKWIQNSLVSYDF